VSPFLDLGHQLNKEGKRMEMDDLFELHPFDKTVQQYEDFMDITEEEEKKGEEEDKLTLLGMLWVQFRFDFMKAGVVKLINDYVQFAMPFVFSLLIGFMDSEYKSPFQGFGYFLAVSFFLLGVIKTINENSYFQRIAKVMLHVRSVLVLRIFNKALALSPAARQSRTIGEIVNYMQLDVDRIAGFLWMAHQVWSSIHQTIGYLLLFYYYIGWSTFIGLAVMLMLVPV
jgi:ABC-type bacteriocin/lantibiotic exporter with double-glycine peptidase domain